MSMCDLNAKSMVFKRSVGSIFFVTDIEL
jgi:hypothetical protein